MSNTKYLNYDLQTGQPLKLSDLLLPNSQAALLKIAEAQFRLEKEIPAGKKMSETDYEFEKGIFSLPDNVGIGESGLTFLYNVYEISYYAMGPTELYIGYEELKKLLKPEWLKVLQQAS